MKTIASFSMILALAGISFAQTAAPTTTTPAPAAKDSVKTAATKKHTTKKSKVAKKSAMGSATPASTASPAVSK
jgi:hypothetical protein